MKFYVGQKVMPIEHAGGPRGGPFTITRIEPKNPQYIGDKDTSMLYLEEYSATNGWFAFRFEPLVDHTPMNDPDFTLDEINLAEEIIGG